MELEQIFKKMDCCQLDQYSNGRSAIVSFDSDRHSIVNISATNCELDSSIELQSSDLFSQDHRECVIAQVGDNAIKAHDNVKIASETEYFQKLEGSIQQPKKESVLLRQQSCTSCIKNIDNELCVKFAKSTSLAEKESSSQLKCMKDKNNEVSQSTSRDTLFEEKLGSNYYKKLIDALKDEDHVNLMQELKSYNNYFDFDNFAEYSIKEEEIYAEGMKKILLDLET